MRESLTLRLALRYTLGHRRGRLASFISWMAIAGLTLGVTILIAVTAVMNGFDRELRERILALVPHITISAIPGRTDQDWEQIRLSVSEHLEVVSATPQRQVHTLLKYRGEAQPALLNGIDPELEMQSGQLVAIAGPALLEQLASEENAIVLGAGLARRLAVGINDRVTFITPQSESQALLNGTARVVGILRSGTELDNQLALYSYLDSSFPLQMQGAAGLRLYVKDLFRAYQVARDIMLLQPPSISAVTWESTHGNLYEAIQLSRQMVGLIVFLVLGIAAFNVVASLFIVSADKQGEMAILKTMGASRFLLGMTFAIQGLIIGLFGTLLGVVLGVFLALNITGLAQTIEQLLGVQLLDLSIYPIDYLPADPQPLQILGIALLSIALCVLASLYPAVRTARIRPATILRHE